MQFNILIDAPAAKVWQALWSDEFYPQWTAAFAAGSRAISNWQQGDKIWFVNEQNSGLVSVIQTLVTNQQMVFKHLGLVKNGEEIFDDPQVAAWAGATEAYTLNPEGEQTQLLIEMGGATLPQALVDYFNQTWPNALLLLKTIAEGL